MQRGQFYLPLPFLKKNYFCPFFVVCDSALVFKISENSTSECESRHSGNENLSIFLPIHSNQTFQLSEPSHLKLIYHSVSCPTFEFWAHCFKKIHLFILLLCFLLDVQMVTIKAVAVHSHSILTLAEPDGTSSLALVHVELDWACVGDVRNMSLESVLKSGVVFLPRAFRISQHNNFPCRQSVRPDNLSKRFLLSPLSSIRALLQFWLRPTLHQSQQS